MGKRKTRGCPGKTLLTNLNRLAILRASGRPQSKKEYQTIECLGVRNREAYRKRFTRNQQGQRRATGSQNHRNKPTKNNKDESTKVKNPKKSQDQRSEILGSRQVDKKGGKGGKNTIPERGLKEQCKRRKLELKNTTQHNKNWGTRQNSSPEC